MMSRLEAELTNLQKRGVSLPKNRARAALEANSMHNIATAAERRGELGQIISSSSVGPTVRASSGGKEVQRIQQENAALVQAMGSKRATMQRTAAGSPLGGDVYAAIPRFYDPLEYWDLSGLPWNVADEGHRHKLTKWLRLYYSTHYLIPILVDIFSRFPLVGMNLEGKDPALNKLYEEHFFNDLEYDEFLVRLGREHWIVGEAFPLASFDENLGVWEREELLNPEDIVIENFQLLGSKQMKAQPPEYLKRLVQTKTPPKEFRQLELSFPEIIPYLLKGEAFPISPVLLKQVANKANDWDDHGTPILLRGLRTLLHEEKLLASQDAIAERLYSPLILAKLGIMDLGDGQGPWIPGPEEIDAVRDDFDLALASDFRLMVHHFGLEVTSVFGREQMPRLGDDFDRIERRLMQVFGVNPSLLSAGASTQPYASSALQAEFLNQILRTYQKNLKRHFRDRALIIAEAQEHYDFERKGDRRVPIYEEVVAIDPETGQPRTDSDGYPVIERKKKLLVPDLDFATLDLRDEATERQFLQTLRQMGVPLSNERLMVGVNFDIDAEVDRYNEGLKKQTIAQQQAKMETYQALVAKGLPVPFELKQEVESVLGGPAPTDPMAGGGGMGAGGGAGRPTGPGGLGPGGGGGPGGPGAGIVMPPPPPGLGPGGQGGPVPGGGAPPIGPNAPQRGTVPEASNERRPGLVYNPQQLAASRQVVEDGDGWRFASESETEELKRKAASTDEETPDASLPELELAANQELVQEDGEQEIIVEKRTAARTKKSYTILDEDAVVEPEPDEEQESSVSEPERT